MAEILVNVLGYIIICIKVKDYEVGYFYTVFRILELMIDFFHKKIGTLWQHPKALLSSSPIL